MASSSNPFLALLENFIPSSIKKMIKHIEGDIASAASEPIASAASEPIASAASEPIASAASEPIASAASEPIASAASEPIASAASERIARMIENKDAYGNVVEFEIEASKVHWSELGNFTSDEEGDMVTNEETFASLKQEWGGFFQDYGDDLVIGEKFAEGGQAEIFHAKWKRSDGKIEKCVVKIFKEGWALHDLQKQWPEGMLKNANDGGYYSSNSCHIYGGLLLKNGRFGFLMEAHDCDLRKLIDDLMIQHNNKHSPFRGRYYSFFWGHLSEVLDDYSFIEDKYTMNLVKGEANEGRALVSIAWAMWALHEHNIIHRDLKASNVLYKNTKAPRTPSNLDDFGGTIEFVFGSASIEAKCYVVSDFECSVGVVGTSYWRAPEILHAVQIGDIKPDLFTKEADVYSFSMTCYEVLTGRIPFEDLGGQDYDVVINGKRPELPNYIDPKLKALLEKCWHSNPSERPSFKYILEELHKIYPKQDK